MGARAPSCQRAARLCGPGRAGIVGNASGRVPAIAPRTVDHMEGNVLVPPAYAIVMWPPESGMILLNVLSVVMAAVALRRGTRTRQAVALRLAGLLA